MFYICMIHTTTVCWVSMASRCSKWHKYNTGTVVALHIMVTQCVSPGAGSSHSMAYYIHDGICYHMSAVGQQYHDLPSVMLFTWLWLNRHHHFHESLLNVVHPRLCGLSISHTALFTALFEALLSQTVVACSWAPLMHGVILSDV
jgi:hypothetical protein